MGIQQIVGFKKSIVFKINTLGRAFFSAGLVLLLAEPLSAQSVLNFPRLIQNERLATGVTISNPTPYFADARFTLYAADGTIVAGGVINPVSYRIPPRGQLSLLARDIFHARNVQGWVQVTSTTFGLTGTYLSGDFSSTLDGAEAATPLSNQVIPLIREDQGTSTILTFVNPSSSAVNLNLAILNRRGETVGTLAQNVGPRAVFRTRAGSLFPRLGGDPYVARVVSSAPVIAMALIETGESTLFVHGQPVDQASTVRVAPHVMSGNGFDSTLILANPIGSPVTVTATLYSETGGPVYPTLAAPSSFTVTIPGNGSAALDIRQITGLVFVPLINGWIRVDSPNVPLNAVLVMEQPNNATAIPLESVPFDRTSYAQLVETDLFFTGLALVNGSSQAANVTITLLRQDGTVLGQRSLSVASNSKLLRLLRDIVPEAAGQNNGFVLVQSSVPIFGLETFSSAGGGFLVNMRPLPVSSAFTTEPVSRPPVVLRLETREAAPGSVLRIVADNFGPDPVVMFGSRAVPARLLAPGIGILQAEVPPIEPGYVTLRLRSGLLESAPIPLRIVQPDNAPVETIEGRAFYEKIEVTDNGLDFNRRTMVPIRNAVVEVVDLAAQTILSVSDTDNMGHFRLAVPSRPNLAFRILSRLRSGELRLADNTGGGAIYAVAADLDASDTATVRTLLALDSNRVSGAFNILEVIQRANDNLRAVDRRIPLQPLTIFWNPRNTPREGSPTEGAVGTTGFNFASNIGFVLGDRSIDSDEFDDSVLLHEYAHLLAARFSRDDSPGGRHVLGDMLDPRLAWSEGWANFFSAASRNDPIYRDSLGPSGSTVLRYDLEVNAPEGDRPGYWSEFSVHSILWDLFDDRADEGDSVGLALAPLWGTFVELANERFVYLPHFLERLLDRIPASANALRAIVQLRSIDFQPTAKPSVSNPFPRPIALGEGVSGEVDSLTTRRTNLIQSAHFLSFRTSAGSVSIRLDITGFGPGNDARANDLDLFLMDSSGRVIERSDRGLNGQSELITVNLPEGTYMVEVRSYYTRAETNERIFNSGRYRVTAIVR